MSAAEGGAAPSTNATSITQVVLDTLESASGGEHALGGWRHFFNIPVPACSAAKLQLGAASDSLIGFGLVVVASAGICVALNVQKLVHLRTYDPVTRTQTMHFTKVPLWWAGVLGNAVFELMNLAALAFAPATLVAPLGCLCVVFNSLTAVFWLKEPFFKHDLIGLILISVGVGFIVSSQARGRLDARPQPPRHASVSHSTPLPAHRASLNPCCNRHSLAQFGSPADPITVEYLGDVVTSFSFYLYLGILAITLFFLVFFAQKRCAAKRCNAVRCNVL